MAVKDFIYPEGFTLNPYHVKMLTMLENRGYDVTASRYGSIYVSKERKHIMSLSVEKQTTIEIYYKNHPIADFRRIIADLLPLYLNKPVFLFPHNGYDYIVVGENENAEVFRMYGYTFYLLFKGKPCLDFNENENSWSSWKNLVKDKDFEITSEIKRKMRNHSMTITPFEGVKVNMW